MERDTFHGLNQRTVIILTTSSLYLQSGDLKHKTFNSVAMCSIVFHVVQLIDLLSWEGSYNILCLTDEI